MAALSALVSGLDAELVRLGYKDSTMLWYLGAWRRLARFFAARGEEDFSLDVAMAWVDDACDFFAKEQAGTLKQTDVYLFRVAQMLGDYAVHGAVLLPVGELADYHAQVGRAGGDWFFPGRAGQPLTLGNVDKNFRRFLWQARIPHGGRGHGPRVHDLRHAFAVNNLRSWFTHGEDVGALLPVLQTYMGHSSISDTAYYLRLTAESYPHISAQVHRVIGEVVPPITAGAGRGH